MTPPSPALPRVVGLRYGDADALPRVILKGSGALADELLQRRRDVPVVHDAPLVDALYRLPVDDVIGPELFHTVAAILTHVLAVDARRRSTDDA